MTVLHVWYTDPFALCQVHVNRMLPAATQVYVCWPAGMLRAGDFSFAGFNDSFAWTFYTKNVSPRRSSSCLR